MSPQLRLRDDQYKYQIYQLPFPMHTLYLPQIKYHKLLRIDSLFYVEAQKALDIA